MMCFVSGSTYQGDCTLRAVLPLWTPRVQSLKSPDAGRRLSHPEGFFSYSLFVRPPVSAGVNVLFASWAHANAAKVITLSQNRIEFLQVGGLTELHPLQI